MVRIRSKQAKKNGFDAIEGRGMMSSVGGQIQHNTGSVKIGMKARSFPVLFTQIDVLDYRPYRPYRPGREYTTSWQVP